MNSTDRKVKKRVMVDLFANETVLQRRRIVVEMPADGDEEALKRIGGHKLDEIATQRMSDADWETEETEGFETIDAISVTKQEVPEHLEADIVLRFDSDDQLITAEGCF